MKNIKRLVVIINVLLIIIVFTLNSLAFERKEHDEYLTAVLFENFKDIEIDIGAKNHLEALKNASYLTIDQFNNSGEKELNKLREYGVNNLPKDISEISYSASGADHRSYTHRGWNFNYIDSKVDWEKRKSILINTADAVFDFNGNKGKRDSFCALVYYIHILGDNMASKSYKVKNGLMMDVGGRIDKEDIIDELLYHFEILFKDQRHTHKYNSLTAKLEKYNNDFSKLVRSEGGINSDSKFKTKQQKTEKVMDLLTMYIPEMLKEENFFSNVFYISDVKKIS